MKNYFTIEEFEKSEIARLLHIPNKTTQKEQIAIQALIDNVLNKLRDVYGKPIYINSGYRCPELNTRVGGRKNSQHLKGEAADLDTRQGNEANKKLLKLILDLRLPFDQLIDEHDCAFIHISYSRVRNRKMFFKEK
jgi:zinc D-Ala-D-Ala carboxypeptidase